MSKIPQRLQEIIEDFNDCEGQEKLEYLLEFAESLPSLPERLEGKQGEMDQVHECITPIFIHPEKKGDGFFFYFDIPPESPTVRGYGSILQQGFDGASLEQILGTPNEFYLQMGLQKVISGQRLNGISAMLAHMKALATGLSEQ